MAGAVRALGMATSTTGAFFETEDGRRMLQRRLGFFMKVGFFIVLGFFIADLGLKPSGLHLDARHLLLHVANLGTPLAIWLVCRRGRLGPRVLKALDGGGILAIGWSAGAMTAFIPPASRGIDLASNIILQLTYWLVTRAALVPSPPVRTFALSLATLVASLGTYLALTVETPGSMGMRVLYSVLWSLCAVVVTTLISWVVYSLRQEVREARRLGQYTLEEKLGEGGMGTVYKARHALLRRPTAVKLLPPERAGVETIERFEREVQLTAGLSHPNTVSIFDYGRTPDGVFYYAMEYLDGVDLERLVKADGPQPPARVAHVLRQVAAALGEAHGVGLIHRDIKPANVILCERGGVPDVAKVVDFGLVRDVRTAEAGLTRDELIKGTPLYMSPESLTAPDRMDGRSDLYSLGAVGYYLLAGVHVFDGRTLVEVCGHHLHSLPVPPSQRLGRTLPAGLEALVLACLEKDPARRPASSRELRLALEELDALGEWREDQARRWWEGWRARSPAGSPPPTNTPTPTMAVALEGRLPPRL